MITCDNVDWDGIIFLGIKLKMASILCIKPSCIIVLASKAGSSKSVVVVSAGFA